MSSGELIFPLENNTGATVTGGLIDTKNTVITTISWEAQIASVDDICISDLCIRVKKPYFTVGDEYIQLAYMTGESMDQWEYISKLPERAEDGSYFINAESSRHIRIKKDRSSWSLSESQIMFGKKTEFSKISDRVYLVKETSGGCGGSSIKQQFIDYAGKSVSFDTLGKNYPKNLQVGKIPFNSYWTKESVSYLWYRIGRDGLNEVEEVFSIQDDVGAKLLSRMKEKREFTHAYAIQYKEYPGIVFFYKSDLQNAERIISLGKDEKWKKENLDSEGNLLDISLTKKILGYYESQGDTPPLIPGGKQVQRKGDTEYDKITPDELTGSLMPIFRVIPLDESGDYLLYTAKDFESVTMAELCKPLVYVYDRFSRPNSLTVLFPQGWVFTKILPGFSRDTTWDFSADRYSSVQVQNEKSSNDYLYYSAKVPNYIYNQNGWQIYGRDIEAFFSEKLDIIGFNPKEKKDFIEYWITEFDSDTLYFVSFKFDTALDPYVTLDFREKPTSQMRVLLESYPLETSPKKEYIWPNVGTRFDDKILKRFVRSGEYDVFEWGGTVQKYSGGTIQIH